MARLARKGDLHELNQVLNKTLKFIFLVLPFSVLLIVLRHEIVTLLFQRGEFDIKATGITAGILPYFMVGAFAFSAQNIVSRGYYAVQNTLFPAVFTSLCVMASLPLLFFLMRAMGPRGVALGLSVSVILQAFVLFECWNKTSKNDQKKEVYVFFLKMILVSLVMAGILQGCYLALKFFIDPSTALGCIGISVLIGFGFMLLFFLIGSVLKVPEILILFTGVYKRLVPWSKNGRKGKTHDTR
jgi:putative peptidoglycan lipid II flippase